MKTNYISLSVITLGMLILGGCFSQTISEKENPRSKFHYSIQLGTNKGGITENTNMADLPGSEIDAFSGATRTGFNIRTPDML